MRREHTMRELPGTRLMQDMDVADFVRQQFWLEQTYDRAQFENTVAHIPVVIVDSKKNCFAAVAVQRAQCVAPHRVGIIGDSRNQL